MLILKGERGKSKVVGMLCSLNSIAIVYYDNTLQFPHYFLNSKTYNLVDLRKYVLQVNSEIDPDAEVDYLIIYTNNTEDEVSGLIGWIEQHMNELNFRDVILTCRN